MSSAPSASSENAGLYAPASLEGTEEVLEKMWLEAAEEINNIDPQTENWKIQNLPLARVKKIMKAEEFVLQELEKDRVREEGQPDDEAAAKVKFMIASDAPVLLSRACELLIRELSLRAWQHTERNRRRTLQRQDVHAAVGESEVYDFLIDIVPRVTAPPPAAPPSTARTTAPDTATSSSVAAPAPAPPPPPPAPAPPPTTMVPMSPEVAAAFAEQQNAFFEIMRQQQQQQVQEQQQLHQQVIVDASDALNGVATNGQEEGEEGEDGGSISMGGEVVEEGEESHDLLENNDVAEDDGADVWEPAAVP